MGLTVWGRRAFAGLICAALVALTSHFSGTAGSVWQRVIGELGIPPASAHRFNRRSGDKGGNFKGNFNKSSEAANKIGAGQQDQLHQIESAQKQLQQIQQVEAVQKRIQNIHDMVAAQQKRVQQLRQLHQMDGAPKKDHHLQQMEAAQQRAERMLATHRHRQQQGSSPPASASLAALKHAGARHQAVLQAVMAKLRGRSDGHGQRDFGRRHESFGHDAFGSGHGHRSVLQHAMDRIRDRRTAHGRNPWGGGHSGDRHHGSRQHAIYSHIHDRLSHRHHRRGRGNEETQTAQTETPKSNGSNKQAGNGGLLQNTPDLNNVSTSIASALPNVVSNKTASADDTSGMSRLGGPQQPSSDDKDSNKARSAKKDGDEADDDGGAVRQIGRLGRGAVGRYLPPPGSFRPGEVLAINLAPNKLATALQRNFKIVEKLDYPSLKLSVTRLETPGAQNALTGRSLLQELMPEDSFTLNHIYVAGRTAPATGPASADPSNKTAPGPASPMPNAPRRGSACSPDRCFGSSIIKWQPQLAACAHGIKIGVIDTGVDERHPAFAGLLFEHRNFVPSTSKKPSSQHGTGVFSLLAGDPQSSTPGLVREAQFFVADAFFADHNGNAISDTVTMMRALNWLKSNKVDVANLSFAGPRDELVEDAIRELAKGGTVILAAAGNEGQDAPPSYPAAYKEVIAVTAVDRHLAIYPYANRGNHIDVAAPGVDVWTALPNRREGPQTGTSFAVPFATSVVALSYPTAAERTDGDPLAPKRTALALLQKSIKAIGGGRGHSPIFGAGLVQAPNHCEARAPGAVASAGPRASDWAGTVKVTPAAIIPPPASWPSTVHPVASHK